MNQARLVQGWNMVPLNDGKIIADVWLYQLDRKNIDVRLCKTLIDLAVDHRAVEIGAGRQPPNLSVELLIAMFDKYKAKTYEQYRTLKLNISHIRDLQAWVAQGGIDEGTAAERLGIILPFEKGAKKMLEELERKESVFLKEHYLAEGE